MPHAMSSQELLNANRIKLPIYSAGQHDATCPQCSAKRKPAHRKVKCLSVLIGADESACCWNCHHCGWSGPKGNGGNQESLTSYIYRDRDGVIRFRKVRNAPGRTSRFFIQHPDGKDGWLKGAGKADTKIIYRADEVAKAIAEGRTIACVEGEKDADNLWKIGIAATCNAHGASEPGKAPKWTSEHSAQLKGADIVVLGDNDAAGYAHADACCKLSLGIAKRVRRLDLAPYWWEIPKGGDVSDWLEKGGGTEARLRELIEQTPNYGEQKPQPENADEAEIERLAKLSIPQYEQERVDAAKRLGMRVAVLDKLVYALRAKLNPPKPTPDEGRIILPPPSAPVAVARAFVEARCLYDGTLTMRFWCGSWWIWKTTHWVEVTPHAVRALLYAFTEDAIFFNEESEQKPWSPTMHKIRDLADALSSVIALDADTEQPCWLDGRDTGPIAACKNGLLDITSRQLYGHTPLFFGQVSVPFPYDPNAPEPTEWLKFLHALWPDESDSIQALQEWYGYIISGRLDLQKILFMVGPTRGGRGVIGRILTALIGKKNVAGPTMNTLSSTYEFALQSLIGKSLAIVPDARSDGRGISSVAVERMLTISGEDTLTIHRKYNPVPFDGKLSVRLQIISNVLPKFADASSAIVGRLVVLVTKHSWLGREDRGLEKRLRSELTSILNWALTGLQRLDAQNQFTHVASADEAITRMQDAAAPLGAFVRELCELGADHTIKRDTLYAAYKEWAEISGYRKMDKSQFGRDLHDRFPSVQNYRPREGKDRIEMYAGICLKKPDPQYGDHPDHPDQPDQDPLSLGQGGQGGQGDQPNVAPAPYEVLGSAPPGERCTACGKGSDVRRIRYQGHVNLWHRACADRYLAAYANPPIKVPPDPSDEGHVCAQCGGASDGTEQPFVHGDQTIWLHAECRRFFKMRKSDSA